MPEQRWPSLADAQRQVWVREGIGWLLIALALIFLLLVLVKHIYLNSSVLGQALAEHIDPLLRNWLILALLWQASPPWQPMRAVPTASSLAEVIYAVWGASAVAVLGGLFLRSASARRAQVREFRQEMQREAWREQARAARGVAPDDRGATTVIGQAVWYQYAAPPEPWSQTIRGILILGLIVALVSGLILLYAEYSFFQARWPSSRN